MPVELENSSAMTVSNSASGENSVSSGHQALPPPAAPVKKKRNLPGMPDPNAEVIALSPKTLMATNRFVCEICSKGFQRDQNLQLHRRGHNLPWKLRQRTGKEVRKRVYVCPEPSCVHHDPSRALGDLTGIKKHFCRKHGEKKWKCDKCSKKYAVQSDWKAHSKTCGTREYRCDCGTLFSRRDSFITHRAFCDALAVESAKAHTTNSAARSEEDDTKAAVAIPVPMATSIPSVVLVQQADPLPIRSIPPPVAPKSDEPENSAGVLQYTPPPMAVNTSSGSGTASTSSNTATLFASLFSSATATALPVQSTSYTEFIGSINRPEPTSLCLSTNALNSSVFSPPPPAAAAHQFASLPPPPSPHMSATALLQKAAQMGAAATSSSFLRGLGLATSSSSSSANNNQENYHHLHQDGGLNWSSSHQQQQQKLEHEPPMLSAGLGLGLPYENGSGLPDLMMGSSSLFGAKPATLDLLGLGIGPGGSATGGLSALMNSLGSGLDASAGPSWEGADRTSSSSAIL